MQTAPQHKDFEWNLNPSPSRRGKFYQTTGVKKNDCNRLPYGQRSPAGTKLTIQYYIVSIQTNKSFPAPHFKTSYTG